MILASREVVIRAVFGENSPLARVCLAVRRPVEADVNAHWPPQASAGRDKSPAILCRAAVVLNIRLPEKAPAAAPVSTEKKVF